MKFFAKSDSDFDHQEIGQARKLTINGGDGSSYEVTKDVEIFIDGWKTPVTDQPPAIPVSPFFSSTTDEGNEKLKLVIGILVEMMGGAVTIQASEIDHAKGLKVIVQQQRDPWMTILRTEQA